MKLAVAILVAFFVFYKWIGMVGNPHVVETAFGLGISALAFFFVLWVLRKRG